MWPIMHARTYNPYSLLLSSTMGLSGFSPNTVTWCTYNTKHINTIIHDFIIYLVLLQHFENKQFQTTTQTLLSQQGVRCDVTTVVAYQLTTWFTCLDGSKIVRSMSHYKWWFLPKCTNTSISTPSNEYIHVPMEKIEEGNGSKLHVVTWTYRRNQISTAVRITLTEVQIIWEEVYI
jgi:hypothetical protein